MCDADTHKHIRFWADSEAEEAAAWKGFLDLIGALEAFTLFHYGSYESRFISSMGKKYGIPSAVQEKLAANCVNILSLFYAHVYLPIYSNDLKSVANFLGFKWSHEEVSGIQSAVPQEPEGATMQVIGPGFIYSVDYTSRGSAVLGGVLIGQNSEFLDSVYTQIDAQAAAGAAVGIVVDDKVVHQEHVVRRP